MKSKILELARLRRKQGHRVHLFNNHPLPITRRQFLAAGLRDSAIFIAAPTILGLFRSSEALAAPAQPATIFICFDSAGGVGHQHRDFLGYTDSGSLPSADGLKNVGIPLGATANTQLVVPMLSGGRFLNALSATPPTGGVTLMDKMTGFSYTATTNDDNGTNQINPMAGIVQYLASKASELPYINNGLSVSVPSANNVQIDADNANNRARTGGHSNSLPLIKPIMPWLRVEAASSVREAIKPPYVYIDNTNSEAVLGASQRLARNRRAQMSDSDSRAAAMDKKIGGLDLNIRNARETASLVLDPRASSTSQGLFPSTLAILDGVTSLQTLEKDRFCTALLAMVRGYATPAMTVVLSGGDYHTSSLTDETAFVNRKVAFMRAAANECLLRNIRLVMACVTDGGMQGNNNGTFGSDAGNHSRQQVFVVSSNRVVPKTGLVGFSDPATGNTVENLPISNNTPMLGAAILGSMLAASGETNWIQELRRLVPASVLSVTDAQLYALNPYAR